MIAFLLLLLVLAVTFLFLSRPQRLARLSSSLLTQITGAQVTIEAARYTFDGTISLRGVSLSIPGLPAGAQKIFEAQHVTIRHDIWSLLKGRFLARQLIVEEPTIFMTEDIATGKFNYQLLQERRATASTLATPTTPANPTAEEIVLPPSLPEIALVRGQARFGTVQDGKYSLVGAMHVSGSFVADPMHAGLYLFKIKQEEENSISISPDNTSKKNTKSNTPSTMPAVISDTTPGFVIRGQFDLNKVALEARLEHFSFGSVQGNWLPSKLRKAWEQLEPSGSFGIVKFGYDPSAKIALSALFELRNAQLTIPVDPVRPKFTGVSGRVMILNDLITIEDLEGSLDNKPFTIDGSIHGFSMDSAFDLALTAGPLELEENPRFTLALPEVIKKQFGRFSPSGKYQAKLKVSRAEQGGKVQTQGMLDLLDASAKFVKFPYRLDHLVGQIKFTHDRVDILWLSGKGQSGATLTVRGYITPLDEDPYVRVSITATDFPMDDLLREALPPRRRPIIDSFFGKETYQKLLDTRLVQTREEKLLYQKELTNLLAQAASNTDQPKPTTAPATQPGDEQNATLERIKQVRKLISRPVFAPGGLTSMTVEVEHLYGEEHDYEIITRLDLAGLNLLFAQWPYPLHVDSGLLTVGTDVVTIDNLRAHGLHGGKFELAGKLKLNDTTKEFEPDLRLVTHDLPIDDLLLSTIPAPQDKWVRPLAMTGKLDAWTHVLQTSRGADFVIDIVPQHVSAKPYGGDFELSDITGKLTLEYDHIDIHSLGGKHNEGTFTMSGKGIWGEKNPGFDLNFIVKQMHFEDPILDLVPKEMNNAQVDMARQALTDFRVTGLYDAQARVRLELDKQPQVEFSMNPAKFGLDYHGHRVELTDMKGRVTATTQGEAQLNLEALSANFGKTKIGTTGKVALAGATSGQTTMTLSFDASAPELEPAVVVLLPESVVRAIESLKIAGNYDIRNAKLIYRPRADQAKQPRFEIQAPIVLRNASAMAGVPMTNMQGRFDLNITDQPGPWPRIEMKLDAQSLLAQQRTIAPLTLKLNNFTNPGILDIEKLRGSMYGGLLMGNGNVGLNNGEYRMNLSLENVSLQPLLHPQASNASTQNATTQEKPENTGGFLNASVIFQGNPSDPKSPRGRGALAIRDANLYNWPLTLTILQIINLALPTSQAFDRAEIQCLIEGDMVNVESLKLEAPTMQIIGAGTMKRSTQEIDLLLHPRNPGAIKLGAITDMLRMVKDELIAIEVTGTLENPKANLKSFSTIRESVRGVTGQPSKPSVPITEPTP